MSVGLYARYRRLLVKKGFTTFQNALLLLFSLVLMFFRKVLPKSFY